MATIPSWLQAAVEEVVEDGVSGGVCDSVVELAARATSQTISPDACRRHVEARFLIALKVADDVNLYRDVAA
jgi:hypothetical protein